jgi:hypothetical protein
MFWLVFLLININRQIQWVNIDATSRTVKVLCSRGMSHCLLYPSLMLTDAGSHAAINTTKLGQFHLHDNMHSGYSNSLAISQKWTTRLKLSPGMWRRGSQAKFNRRFGGTYCFNHQGMLLASRAKQGTLLFASCWLLLPCEPEDRSSVFLRNVDKVLPDSTASLSWKQQPSQ